MSEPLVESTPLPIGYAVPTGRAPSVWAGVIVAFIGLALVFFGGCFMIGILLQMNFDFGFGVPTRPWGPGDYLLHVVLYGLAAACFASGAILLIRGTKSLIQLAGSSHA